MNSKQVIPKLIVTNTPASAMILKKKGEVIARKSTSLKSRPRKSLAKLSARNARKSTKTEAIRSSVSHKKSTSHKNTLTVPNDHFLVRYADSQCKLEEAKAIAKMPLQRKSIPRKSFVKNRNLFVPNMSPRATKPHREEGNTQIRYSRRMPLFPPVSSSHMSAQPVTSNQCRISLVGESGGKKAMFTQPNASLRQSSVEPVREYLLDVPKLSVVSLKLPNIIHHI